MLKTTTYSLPDSQTKCHSKFKRLEELIFRTKQI